MFHNYSHKAKSKVLNIYQNIYQCSLNPETNNHFSTIFRGDYQELQNNRRKHNTTDAIVTVCFLTCSRSKMYYSC